MNSIIAKVIALRKLEELERKIDELEKKVLEKTKIQKEQQYHALIEQVNIHEETIKEFQKCLKDINMKPFVKKEFNSTNKVSIHPSF